MNIDIQGYTREQILSALFSSTRQVRFEYTIADSSDNDLGYIEGEQMFEFEFLNEIVENTREKFENTTLEEIIQSCEERKQISEENQVVQQQSIKIQKRSKWFEFEFSNYNKEEYLII